MPCPIAREIGELLNLPPRGGVGKTSRTGAGTGSAEANAAAGIAGGDGGGKAGKRRRGGRSSLGNRWLHDVMEVAEAMKAERMEIVLDEKVWMENQPRLGCARTLANCTELN